MSWLVRAGLSRPGSRARHRSGGDRRGPTRVLPGCVVIVGATLLALPASAQQWPEFHLPDSVGSTFEGGMVRNVEAEIHAAILAGPNDQVRDAHIERAEAIARDFVRATPRSAEAHYWLAVALGLRTENSGPFAKLTVGKECFEATSRVLELDPDHAGGHELLGRIHAGVMRLPWVVRKLASSLGMSDAMGEASWESAESHLVRSARLDPQAIAPPLELGKMLTERDRFDEGRDWLERALEIEARSELDEAMQAEARELLRGSAPS